MGGWYTLADAMSAAFGNSDGNRKHENYRNECLQESIIDILKRKE